MRNLLFVALVVFVHRVNYAQSNYALQFNSTNKYVQVSDNAALDVSGAFTLEAWIYPTGPGSHATEGGMIINKENTYEIARFADGTIRFALSANGGGTDWAWTSSGLTAPLNQWSHLALVKNGATVTLYLNSKSPATFNAQPAVLAANTQPLRIGSRANSAVQNFDGLIDEVRIWNTARTQHEVKTNMFNKSLANNASGLVAYYRMNEGSATTANNSCTNVTGINGTLFNNPGWAASPVQFTANGMALDGSNDYISVPDNAALDISNAITLEAWCYATKNTGIQNVICKSSQAVNTGYIFPRTDNGWTDAVVYLHIGGWQRLSAPYPSLNAWHHLAATYDGATIKMYIDGNLVASMPKTGNISVNNNVLALGNQPGYAEYFGGKADEIRVWNVARTQAQIQNNMQNELDPSTQTGLVAYYTFNQGIPDGDNAGLSTLIDRKADNYGTLTNFSLSGTLSNYSTQYVNLVVLPLQWLNFKVQKKEEEVLLSWSTSLELNTKNFTIQRSNGGVRWNDISIVRAAGTSNTILQYSYTDEHPAPGLNSYRILSRDSDGAISYSEIQSVKFASPAASFAVLENPVNGGSLRISVNKTLFLSLYSFDGRLLWAKQFKEGTTSIDVSHFAKGTYVLQSMDTSVKFIIQ